MTMAGGVWTPTTVTPAPGTGPLTPASAAVPIMTWMADNRTGEITALDARNAFDLILSLFKDSGIAQFTLNTAYPQGSVVYVAPANPGDPFAIYLASGPTTAANNANPPGTPGADPNWSPLPITLPVVTTATNAAEAPGAFAWPAGAPAAKSGDVFINTTDKRGWVNDGTTWVPLPSADLPVVTYTITPNVVPGTPVPGAGQTQHPWPAPPAPAPKHGDVFVNGADGAVWYALVPPGAPLGTPPDWVAVTRPPTKVTVSSTAGETPAAPGTTTLPAANEDDVFVNTADGESWIYDADTAAWVKLSGTPAVTVVATLNETPATHTPALVPTRGDVFINTADQKTWVFGLPANAAPNTPADWQPVTGTLVIHTDTTGETPQAPGTHAALLPTAPESGDIFYNETDRSLWMYMPDPAPGATTLSWELIPLGAQVIITDTTGETPQAPGGVTLPAAPAVGTVFINSTDRKLWIFHDDPAGGGTPIWSALPDAEANHVSVEPTDGTLTPATFFALPAHAGAPAPSVGDLFYNQASDNLWAWDGAAWQPMNAQTAHVFISATANEVPENAQAGQTNYDFVAPFAAGGRYAGQSLKEGDRYINTQDLKNYIYAPDPTTPGAFTWVEVPADNRAWVSITPGEDAAAFTFQPPPKIGDIYYNKADKRLWVRALDPDPAVNAVAWVEVDLKSPTHYIGDGPFDPTHVDRANNWGFTGAVSPDPFFYPPKDGDTFFMVETGQGGFFTASNPNNPPDGAMVFQLPAPAPDWDDTLTYREGELVWYRNALYRASRDVPANQQNPLRNTGHWDPVHPEHDWLMTDIAGRTPQDAVTAGEIDNEPNLIYLNTADRKMWVNILDTADTLGWQEVPLAARVFLSSTQYQDPWGTMPTVDQGGTALEGDIFVNEVDQLSYIVAKDPAGNLEWYQMSQDQRDPRVWVTTVATETPMTPAQGQPATYPETATVGQHGSPAHPGSVFINREDGRVWVVGPDPVSGDLQWELVAERDPHIPDWVATDAYRKFDFVRVTTGNAPGFYRALVDVGAGGTAPDATSTGIWELVVVDSDAHVFNLPDSATITSTPPATATMDALHQAGLKDGDIIVIGPADTHGNALTQWRYDAALNTFTRITPKTSHIFWGVPAPTTQVAGVTPNVDDIWIVSPVLTATAGAPGAFAPAAKTPPDLADLQQRGTMGQTAAWTTGQHIILGDASHAYWDGTSWQAGDAP